VGGQRFQHRLEPQGEPDQCPFFKTVSYPLGVWGFIALTYCVIVGPQQRRQSHRRARRTRDHARGDGRPPLVGIFAYVTSRADFSPTCSCPHIPGAGELDGHLAAAIAGAGLGFLWFNAYPATCSWATSARWRWAPRSATVAVIVRQEIVLFIMGGVFVVETLSVIVQGRVVQDDRQRVVLRMARRCTIHYELKGLEETRWWSASGSSDAARAVWGLRH
jgi:phospho-N-acetylmuramoyl-pentapeptide-transferase